MSAAPRLVGSAVRRGILPAGAAALATVRREGFADLHWKASGDALARFLQGTGPVLTKLGQILATRDDLLPGAVCRRLDRLYAEQPPMSARQLRRILKLAYPEGDPFERFEHFEREPMAVGSIGQVHRAQLRDGSPVVVKLLRPGIEAALERDMRGARAFLDLFFRFQSDGDASRHTAAVHLLEDLSRAFAREVDFDREASALEDFAKRLSGSSTVCVPHCYREHSSRTVLVLEELKGVPLSELRGSDGATGDDARLAADLALTAILSQVFSEGHFHADPHAGNLLLLEDGRLGLIDLGLTGQLGKHERRIIARAVRSVLARDADATLRLLLELGNTPTDFDLDSYRREISGVLRQHGSGALSRIVGGANPPTPESNGLESMMDELFAVTRRHGISLPESTTLLIKTLVTIEGVARSLDPEINVMGKAVPIVLRSLAPRWLRWARALISWARGATEVGAR